MGKSTLIRLLLKKCKCTRGTIDINGININDIDIQYLYDNISTMAQESNLLSGTVREILDPFNKNIEDEKMYSILENLMFDIEKLSEGLDTYIHPNMTNLSGGEKQKIALLRSFSKNASLIILDEPSSALDSQSKKQLVYYINATKKSKIYIIVSHDQEILSCCDYLIDCQGGSIAE